MQLHNQCSLLCSSYLHIRAHTKIWNVIANRDYMIHAGKLISMLHLQICRCRIHKCVHHSFKYCEKGSISYIIYLIHTELCGNLNVGNDIQDISQSDLVNLRCCLQPGPAVCQRNYVYLTYGTSIVGGQDEHLSSSLNGVFLWLSNLAATRKCS